MNRFRTKRKAKEEDGAPRPSQDSESSMPFRGFRKGKKSQETEKKEIDIASALPSNDDFRTSLLMTGLSARFSMLREQDDPNTKIGKASDDSVLFPKRQSRMDMSSFHGLGDIAEVESIKAASPFTRMDSYHSDDADSLKGGSIMSRAKPTEGNNLFGGRQKIYKIPASASSSRTIDGGMGGRALYDDDVAQSAFQKWRRAEKERELSQNEPDETETTDDQRNSSTDLDPSRSESPVFSSYNRKRETSSTLSSVPSIARHSSAATSITSSQPATSLKDWQPSSGYSSGPERSVTRTRRLYETGFFNQDAQESTTSSLSRMDTSGRQRPFGTRTPDLGQSPSSLGLTDRLSGERRLLAKGSAPNLRSMSPPASASSAGTPNLGVRVPSGGESKSNYGAAPPLSPPISETDETAILPINPNDLGKATALGVFQKPAQPYDESKYAQRQLLLQRGRETPTQRARDEPNPPNSRDLPSSNSPDRKAMVDSPTAPEFGSASFTAKDAAQPTSFLDFDGSETSSIMSARPLPSPQIHLRRPSDREHPALRDSTLPTPLSVVTKTQGEPSPAAETSPLLAVDSQRISPADSPTLGPVSGGGGLSGMVRQHLRANSNASSIYEGVPPTAGFEARFPADTSNSKATQEYGTGSNPWESEDQGRDWNLDLDVNEPLADAESLISEPSSKPVQGSMDPASPRDEKTDEFASQLADGARRIREKLTSYVETDSRSSSPHRPGEHNESVDLAPLPRPSGLGSILRPRSSRGSLVERGREPSSAKAFKMMGISPGGSRTASPGSESQRGRGEVDAEPRSEKEEKEAARSSEDQHPGLRQFRQARRELQRLKELELQSRHPPAPEGPPPDIPSPQRRVAQSPGGPGSRTPIRDQKPPPAHYQQRILNEEPRNSDLSVGSQAPPQKDRQRSESESSQGARTNNRAPTRPADGLAGRENMHLGPAASAPRPAIRSPGLPGTDIKRSHIMPPQPHPNASLRMNQSNLDSNGKLHVPRGYETSQPSPTSPGVSPQFNSAPPTPATLSHHPSAAQTGGYDSTTGPTSSPQDAIKRKVRPRDISEPTLVMSTSRVPTVALPPEAEDNRSRSNGRNAPPLPPINPRRRQDSSKVRTVLETFARQGRDNLERGADEGNEPGAHLRRPQKPITDMGINFGKPRGNSPPTHVGPPASRIVSTQGRSAPGSAGLPGGMI